MKLFFQVVRFVLGKIILLLNALFPPRAAANPPEQQLKLDEATAGMTLYEFEACPFCVRVRREARRLGLKLKTRDAKEDPQAGEELLRGGGQRQVPCLRYADAAGTTKWLYESADIIEFLRKLHADSRG